MNPAKKACDHFAPAIMFFRRLYASISCQAGFFNTVRRSNKLLQNIYNYYIIFLIVCKTE